jgi:hypothetical protein
MAEFHACGGSSSGTTIERNSLLECTFVIVPPLPFVFLNEN